MTATSVKFVDPAISSGENTGKIRDFWNTEACGTHFVGQDKQPGSAEFFQAYDDFRYVSEWHIPALVPFHETRGKKVLEIGCGNGADGARFARAGALYTGVDLTEAAVEATRQHFRVCGLHGTFQMENAERLSFPDEQFDFVYSYGVLHHTREPQRAFAEVYRVLKPGGRAVIMLYHRRSFNYYLRIMFYMRLRLLWRILKSTGKFSIDRNQLVDGVRGLRGNEDPSLWQIHYQNFLRVGWRYLSTEEFVHHATDGPECPFAYVYTRQEVLKLFKHFQEVRTASAHFPLRKYSIGRWIPRTIEKKLGAAVGWYLYCFLKK